LSIVGLADRACQEAMHRVHSGLTSAKLEWPMRRITVNLARAALRNGDCLIAFPTQLVDARLPHAGISRAAEGQQTPKIEAEQSCTNQAPEDRGAASIER
jgi:hypothetical protein